MKIRFRFHLMTITVLTILTINAVWAAPVLADDGAPPPADMPVETVVETPPASTEEPVIEDSIPAVEQLQPEEPVIEDSTPVVEELQQLPEGTEVVVTNEEGDILPLASSEAAQIINNNDPMWCPVGVTPGGAGCTSAFASMDALITELNTAGGTVTDPAKAGVIWIAGGYDSSIDDPLITNFTLDGTILVNMAKFALTIQGGWTGTGKVVNQLDPSEFNASLSIIEWKGAVTLNDILISGATVNPNSGTSATSGLIVKTASTIILNRIQVTDSGVGLNGADLDNQVSTTFAPVIVNESIFNNNAMDGLRVASLGAISIRNLTANKNGADDGAWDYGAFITNWLTIDANKPITLSGMNQFKGNLGTGLFVSSFGTVTLNNIIAYANDDGTDDDGSIVPNGDEGDGAGVHVDSSGSIKMTGSSLITDNQINGLELYSEGVISLNNVNASNNGDNGAYINNCLKFGLNPACVVIGKPVTLTGNNVFNENGIYGLYVESDGAITISQVTANENVTGAGVLLDNCASDGTACTNTPYAISFKLPSVFLSNGFDGMHILTAGPVTLKGITANSNHNRGVFIDNHASLTKPQNVTLSGTNVINGNDNVGLRIISYGAIALNNITANDNGLVDLCTTCNGVYVDNVGYSGVPITGSILLYRKPVTFTGVNVFNNNHISGAFVYSLGAVTMSNVTAMGNDSDGIYIDNDWEWHPNGAVAATAFSANITFNGYGVFEGNGDEGLQIDSRGAIRLNNITATDNTDVGVYVDNSGYGVYDSSGLLYSSLKTRQPVTIVGSNRFNNNDGGGLSVYSLGAITLSNITASGNLQTGATGSGHGVLLSNDLPWHPTIAGAANYAANVTLTGYGYFEDNYDDGLYIQSRGVVTMTTLTANNNGNYGVYISNTGDVLPQNVTISGVNNFVGNGFTTTGDGLFIQTDGKITISNLNAIGNTGNGAWLDNFTDKKANKFLGVTLTGVNSFQLNLGANGLYIDSDGIVTLSNINADDNAANGVQASTTKNLTLMCANAYSNGGTGFLLDAGGLMTLKGVHAYGNVLDESLLFISTPIRTWNCP